MATRQVGYIEQCQFPSFDSRDEAIEGSRVGHGINQPGI